MFCQMAPCYDLSAHAHKPCGHDAKHSIKTSLSIAASTVLSAASTAWTRDPAPALHALHTSATHGCPFRLRTQPTRGRRNIKKTCKNTAHRRGPRTLRRSGPTRHAKKKVEKKVAGRITTIYWSGFGNECVLPEPVRSSRFLALRGFC